jgi:phosphohistidine swiveling domain-containing protein
MLVELARAEDAAKQGVAVGRKAARLGWLIRHRFPVPDGFVVPPTSDGERVRDAINERLDPAGTYAVRSSADVEDGAAASFAGQFESVLDVVGVDNVVDAIERVRRSTAAPGLAAYAARHGIDPASIAMAVIVQRMVKPIVSGVAFSRNPLTGLDEVVIEAVPGRGDALVQEGTTPDRWVHRWGDFVDQPSIPRTDPALAFDVATTTRRIATVFGAPVDAEWVFDGTGVHWVQVRPIVGIDAIPLYSNRIAREVLPGIIKPLVWSLNIPIVNRAWVTLITEAIGPNDLRPERLARAFGHRAYFDMRALGDVFVALGMPRDSLEVMLGLPKGSAPPRFRPTRRTMRHVPRMLRLVRRLDRFDQRVAHELPILEARYRDLASADLRPMADEGLLARVDRLAELTERAAYLNIVAPLLMNLYGAVVRRRAAAHGLDPASIDPARDDPGIRAHDPRAALLSLGKRLRALDPAILGEVRASGLDGLPDGPASAELRVALDAFMERFGHLSESGNDLSAPRWRDDPDAVIRMALDAKPSSEAATLTWDDVAGAIGRGERPILRRVFRRAATYRRLREDVSALYTYGYGLLGPTVLEIGRRLVDRGVVDRADDIFYLEIDDVRSCLRVGGSAQELVADRRASVAEAVDLDLPETIVGDDYVPRRRSTRTINTLEGVPTSRGTYEGPVRVIRSTSEFDRMQDGAVLVIPHSDVAWTPLFARAGAVVAESGGMLSHSSIVAREHGIPCVVSVNDACAMPDGARVHVDGYRGTVTVAEP